MIKELFKKLNIFTEMIVKEDIYYTCPYDKYIECRMDIKCLDCVYFYAKRSKKK